MQTEIHLDILTVASHPDDAELSVGGTLLKLKTLGYKTGVVDVTAGELGTRGSPEIRAQEASQAATRLDLAVRENLDLGDGHVWLNEETRTHMVRTLRKYRPRVVLTHYWDDPHPDHAHTARIVREAAHVSGLNKYDLESGQQRWRPSAVAHFLFPRTVAPTFIVDISEFFEKKMEAVGCYTSQFFNPSSDELTTRVSAQQFLDEVEARDRHFGALIGVPYGEGFFVHEALNVADPMTLLTQQMNLYS